VGIVLGSGLGKVAESCDVESAFRYTDIPGFPCSTVPGHKGELLFSRISGKSCVIMNGRCHLYEGYGWEGVTLPVSVMGLLGVSKLIVTNSAGGINRGFQRGDLMLICDHIAFLLGGVLRFTKITSRSRELYSKGLLDRAIESASAMGINLRQGVLASFLGPSYETPAELEMVKRMGADAVTMSTVPEVIAARERDMEVVGISCISNLTWMEDKLDHECVVNMAERTSDKLSKLIRELIGRLH
jgi:purine-nucleoside phosphorylase